MTKTPIEPKDIRKGDLIRCEYGDVSRRANVAVEYYAACDGFYVGGTQDSFFLLDRPKPPVVLPTEIGAYLDTQGDVWVIAFAGDPMKCGGDMTGPELFAPFTKLEPVAQIAEQALLLAVGAIEGSTPASTSYKTIHARAVKHAFRNQFGVTP